MVLVPILIATTTLIRVSMALKARVVIFKVTISDVII